jgi:hypothetical protein
MHSLDYRNSPEAEILGLQIFSREQKKLKKYVTLQAFSILQEFFNYRNSLDYWNFSVFRIFPG